jgi:hypothetical protein
MYQYSIYFQPNLDQEFEITQFLSLCHQNNEPLQGVYALEDSNGKTSVIDYSFDVGNHVEKLLEKNKAGLEKIRVQSFSNPSEKLLISYKNELLKQTNSAISESKIGGALIKSPFDATIQKDNKEKSSIIDVDSFTTTFLELNKENVEKVLDEVRPYLVSDGGNVSIYEIDAKNRDIKLVLEGACGSCPSSTVKL